MNTLYLSLKSEFFNAIKVGSKTKEYRLRNAYWDKRLENRQYDKIVLTLGYPPAGDIDRRLVLPYRGYVKETITHAFFGPDAVDVYAIDVSGPAILQQK